MRKPETAFKEDIVKPALEALPNSWCEKIQQVTINGTPDFLCCINSTFVAIELKKSKHDQETVLQNYKLKQIASAGGISIVVSPECWDMAHAFLIVLATEGLAQAKENIH